MILGLIFGKLINIIGNATVISTILHFIVILLSKMHSDVYSEFMRFLVCKHSHRLSKEPYPLRDYCMQTISICVLLGTNFRFAFSVSSEAIACS